MLQNRFAEYVPDDEINLCDEKVWFLPHHHVSKKSGKLRIVHDCAFEVNGVSLNKSCYQGPDLNNLLLGVLLRFRRDRFALTTDIEAMFMQIKIAQKDRNALRFLWRNHRGEVQQFHMTSHLFGGIWCPSIAMFVLRKTTQLYGENSVKGEVLSRSFYVDDLLLSFKTRLEMEEMLFFSKDVLRQGEFNLTKFLCNDVDVIKRIEEGDCSEDYKLSSRVTKVLGVRWNFHEDKFHFKINVPDQTTLTRRSMLQTVASIYDPMGLISPSVLSGRILVQETTRLKLIKRYQKISNLDGFPG